MDVQSVKGSTENGYYRKETSVNPGADGYEALIIGGVCPGKEQAVEAGLGCSGQGLWFRCEGALLWDPYGSLVRSILMAVHRFSALRAIYVVAEACSPGSREGDAAGVNLDRMRAGIPINTKKTMNYLLRHIYGVDLEQWLGSAIDPASTVLSSMRLLREHPLMPESMCIQGFLIEDAAETRLLPVYTDET